MGACVTLYVLNQDAYDKTLLPAYQAFFGSGDVCPILKLIEQAQALPPNEQDDSELWTSELNYYQEILGRFNAGGGSNLKVSVDWGNGLQRPLTEIVRVNLAPVLMRFLCLVRRDNRIVEQAVWKSDFMPYLYQHSDWLERFFTFSFSFEGGLLEIPWGECTELLSTAQAIQLLEETLKVPSPPEAALRVELNNLAELVRLGLSDPKFSVAIAVS